MTLDVSPIKQTALGEQVAHELRVLIVTGRLPAGQHLVESSLSQDFGVSRGPIRDALKKLESEGLVETRGRGTYVIGLDDVDVDELFSLRESLESLALRLCAERLSGEWAAFERPLTAMREAADRGDAAEFAVADLEFHSYFYELCGHRRLLNVWREFQPTFTTLLQVTTAQDEDLHPSAESHAEILERLRRGETEDALNELREHLQGASRRLREAQRQIVEG
ncbi:GntR family transcriptional regulator, partial [Phytoactinopolyspora endophytica]|uniref:GntR family transcriptional regulator n=1 Tax=Phytoactinopolyspora endophytica TaxID=1642495 RepID=UPI0013EAFA84